MEPRRRGHAGPGHIVADLGPPEAIRGVEPADGMGPKPASHRQHCRLQRRKRRVHDTGGEEEKQVAEGILDHHQAPQRLLALGLNYFYLFRFNNLLIIAFIFN